jgi:hypothetical protein
MTGTAILGPMHPSDPSDSSTEAVPDALDGIDGYLGSGGEVLGEIEDFLRRYLVLPDDHAFVAVALWAAHTHMLKRFDSTPRLAFLSPEPGSGKSRAQEVLETLTPAPLRSANVTVSVLFRLIDESSPTIYMDEVDSIWTGPGQAEELRALVNAGHRRGSDAARMTGEGKNMKVKRFATFAPICLAGLGGLPATVADRSLIIHMKRRLPGEPVEPWRFRSSKVDGEQIREELALWARALVEDDGSLEVPVPVDDIADRAWDCWEPLITVADAAGGNWPDRARAACRAFTRAAAEAMPGSSGIRLLTDLRSVWPGTGSAAFMGSEELLGLLHGLESSPWGEEPVLTARALASLLRGYGIKPGRNSDQSERGYYRAYLTDAWTRYLRSAPPVIGEQEAY